MRIKNQAHKTTNLMSNRICLDGTFYELFSIVFAMALDLRRTFEYSKE